MSKISTFTHQFSLYIHHQTLVVSSLTLCSFSRPTISQFLMKKSLLPMKNASSSEKQMFGKEELEKLLEQNFGHSGFRGKQLEAIQAVLSGRDCFCLMPTGGGKSMCYQIPALAKPGIVLVISPLIALMENQVTTLKKKRISAEFLSSTQTARTKERIHEDLNSGKPSVKLLYVTPELVATKGFMTTLTKLYNRGLLSLIAIDEAHCISTWGHDFRPSYRKLSSLRSHLQNVPILALTATAVPKVEKDVIESLNLHQPTILRASFNRANIYYEVRYKELLGNVYNDLSNLLKSSGNVCSIIYCLERTTCNDLSEHLSKQGISSAAYHAGLNNKMRSAVLDYWLSSKIQVVVATVAFGTFHFMHLRVDAPCIKIHALFRLQSGGTTTSKPDYKVAVTRDPFMNIEVLAVAATVLQDGMNPFCLEFNKGIDRNDVRMVCHFNVPKSMEAFYQESGRAGRDQLPSRSILYYGLDDRRRMEFILSNAVSKKPQSPCPSSSLSKKSLADLNQIVEYCEGSGCRRKKILESFGEQVSASFCQKTCDACKHPNLVSTRLEELNRVPSIHKKDGLAPVFIKSSLVTSVDGLDSEFWNRDDETNCSDEDISNSDDEADEISTLSTSKMSSKAGLDEKFKALQQAEEAYYQNKVKKKSSGLPDKKIVSEELREGSKKRLLNALNQAQERLGEQLPAIEASVTLLEMECFKKYEKVGKTFYNSQVAATIRWISSSSFEQICDRLNTNHSRSSAKSNDDYHSNAIPSPQSHLANSEGADYSETSKEITHEIVQLSMEIPREKMELPPILSLSEFAEKNAKGDGSARSSSISRVQKRPDNLGRSNPEKKMRQG